MAALTIQDIVPGGTQRIVAGAGSGGDTIPDDGREQTFLAVVNNSGSTITVTVTAVTTSVNVPGVGALTISDKVVSVTTATTEFIGPFSAAYRNSSGNVTVTCSATTSVSVGAFRLPKVSI